MDDAILAHGDLQRGFAQALADDQSQLLRVSRPLAAKREFAASVARGMQARPRQLECRFLYDKHGSALYEKICRQPEYYPTRTEASILARVAPDILECTGPVTLVELGAGSAVKTDFLLKAYSCNDSACYVPIDISEAALFQAGQAIAGRRPDVRVIGIHGTYEDASPLFAAASPLMAIFLGSTIGNFSPDQADYFWEWIADHLGPDDFFLLGVDLIKDRSLLEAAYNDAAGITQEFTRNLFGRMNRELDAGLDLGAIVHEAHYNEEDTQIEIHARFTKAQTLHVSPLHSRFGIGKDERILVEISRKFSLAALVPYLESFGFKVRRVYQDDRQWFGLLLLEKIKDRFDVPVRFSHGGN